jgi:hypothetical protein
MQVNNDREAEGDAFSQLRICTYLTVVATPSWNGSFPARGLGCDVAELLSSIDFLGKTLPLLIEAGNRPVQLVEAGNVPGQVNNQQRWIEWCFGTTIVVWEVHLRFRERQQN